MSGFAIYECLWKFKMVASGPPPPREGNRACFCACSCATKTQVVRSRKKMIRKAITRCPIPAVGVKSGLKCKYRGGEKRLSLLGKNAHYLSKHYSHQHFQVFQRCILFKTIWLPCEKLISHTCPLLFLEDLFIFEVLYACYPFILSVY